YRIELAMKYISGGIIYEGYQVYLFFRSVFPYGQVRTIFDIGMFINRWQIICLMTQRLIQFNDYTLGG
ncbi:MAG: hypothetical protein PHD40_06975, partial [Syntrophomonadaceae bacterium]|nr:hypothetical protein [Syntrophomonadaceae bacterium]